MPTVQESFYRPDELARETRSLPADTYNLAHTLLTQAAEPCIFVPIRSMQYLAVLDREEFIFVDREGGRCIEIAWQSFDPRGRTALTDPVPYQAVFYDPKAPDTMKRLQGDFNRALHELAAKRHPHVMARIIRLNPERDQ